MKFNFESTGIGSVPFKDPKLSCQKIFDNFPAIPFWPQLPKRTYLESMYAQFSERMPGLVMDDRNKTIHVDTTKVAAGIEEVYSKYLDGDVEFFKISREYAAGLYEFLEGLKTPPKDMKFAKGQIVGPVSYALSVTDQNKRSIIYDKDLFEIAAKVLTMKARWQARKFKKIFPGVMIFIDEPYLVSIGSSYVNIDIGEAAKKLDELIEAVRKEGAIVGMHCCGNTDWSFMLKRPIDVLSFDAYNYGKEFLLYPADIKNFLMSGGTVAWGMVPSSEAIDKESKTALAEKAKGCIKRLVEKGIGPDIISSIITPSCGLGTLDEERVKKILDCTRFLSEKLL